MGSTVVLMLLGGCAGEGEEQATEPGVECTAPTTLQVQVAHVPGAEGLMITSGGIGASSLHSADPADERPAPDEQTALHELPSGLHARIVDLSTGETVRAETLNGGAVRTDMLEPGDYRVGLISVEGQGRIDGIATAELQVDEQGGMVTLPEVDQPRELQVSSFDVRDGAAHVQVAAGEAEDASMRLQWRLDGPDEKQSGAAEEESVLLEDLSDGPHVLGLAAEDEQAPGVVEQAVRCEFTVAEGEAQPTPGGAEGA